ncbi:MAG: hypothetical protein ACYC91_02495 [Solirubrobacteraceae bacterium]
MGYKILGFLVWQVGKLYFRRRMRGVRRRVARAGLGVAVFAAVVAAGRQRAAGASVESRALDPGLPGRVRPR